MKKIVPLLVIIFTTILLMTSFKQKTSFSKDALNEKLIARDGNQIAFKNILEKYKDKTVVIEVWASWCSDCVKAMPKIKEAQQNNPNTAYIFISMDKTAEKWKEGIEKHQLQGDHFLASDGMKGNFGKAIDLDWIPRYIIIDKNQKIVLYRAIETDFDIINATLKSLK